MRTIGIGLVAFSMLAAGPVLAGKPSKPTVVAAAPTDAKKANDGKPADAKPVEPAAKPAEPAAAAKPADAKPGDAKPGEAKPGDAKPGEAKPAEKPKVESIDALLEQAGTAANKAQPVPETKPAEVKPATKAVVKVAPKVVPQVPTADAPPPTGTEDNDDAAEAAKVTKLEAVKQAERRHIGPYELGPLDCRTLDGAGIERVLRSELVAGEEPDVLCRVIVTQPGDIVSSEHSLTLSVLVGGKETWKQQRKVRMSSIGRRAMVFVVPMDKIASDDEAIVTFNAVLSQPATPAGGRIVKVKVRPLD